MDAIFKALSDDTRRKLLDMLREHDGQTLTELEAELGMTRFGVMKHLKVLEEASLVVTRKSGRFKYHYLNAVPLQTVIDRWIEPLVQKPMSRMALDLKAQLEGSETMTLNTKEAKPDFVLQTFIKTTREELWDALTKPELVKQYHFAGAVPDKTKKQGERVEYILPDGSTMLALTIVDEEPGKRLDMTFDPKWEEGEDELSRCVYEIDEVGDVCRLTILHFNVTPKLEGVREGWSRIAASLKSFVETGQGISYPPMAKAG
jgi:DNA-binding transcriptional ArsR family regulator